jgi:tetratricopeptide (TPR) repeat protein
MQYKGTNKTIPEIAKELGVAYILEGSIRKYGNKIRVTAQLINAENDEHLWANNYDKTLTDIFAIQTEVSQEIVSALRLNISVDEEQSLAAIPTQNIEAYKLFLLGRKEADKRNKESIAKSITLYKEAIALDTNYAEAYAEIANSIYLETYYSRRDPVQASLLANEYLDQAEAINNKVSRIYSVRGLINNIEGKHDESVVAFEKAISLSPNDLTARHQYSTFFYYTRQYEKQLEQAEIAYRLDPLSFVIANSYATALAFNHRYDEAELVLNKVEKLGDENNVFVINRSYFRLYLDQKKYSKAIPHLRQMVDEENVFNRFLGFCYAKVGDTINAKKTIDAIHKRSHPREKSHQLAVVYAGLEITDSVLYYLDTIRNKQSKTLGRENTEFFNYLQDDPRYIALLKAHGIALVD